MLQSSYDNSYAQLLTVPKAPERKPFVLQPQSSSFCLCRYEHLLFLDQRWQKSTKVNVSSNVLIYGALYMEARLLKWQFLRHQRETCQLTQPKHFKLPPWPEVV